ncbi:MAG: PilZ domain-containing protein [Motiliproteus sp.]
MKLTPWNPEEQRRSPRIDVDLSAEIRTEWQQLSPAKVVNLSQHGIGVEGSGALIEMVFPNFNHSNGNHRSIVYLRVGLLEGAVSLVKPWVDIQCHSAYVKRIGHDRFLIGLSYAAIDGDAKERLDQFLDGI